MLSGFLHCIDNNTTIALAGHSRVNIDRGLSPIELKQDCATPIYSNFAERLSTEQILAQASSIFTRSSCRRFVITVRLPSLRAFSLALFL